MTALFAPPCRLAFLVSAGNSNGNAGGAGVLPPFEPGEYHESPETTETRPADSLAASPSDCRQRSPAHEGEAGTEGRRSVKRLCGGQPAAWDAIWLRFGMPSGCGLGCHPAAEIGQPMILGYSCGFLSSAPKARPKIAQGKRPQGASPWVGAQSKMSPVRATKNTMQRLQGTRW